MPTFFCDGGLFFPRNHRFFEDFPYLCRCRSSIIYKMEQEERQKEIEWLMGSIKRSYAQGNGEAIFIIIVFALLAVFGVVLYILNYHDDEIRNTAPQLLLFFGGFCAVAVTDFVFRKKMARAESPQELLATHDRMWVLKAVLWTVLIGSLSFIMDGSLFSRICFVLGLVLLAVTNWLSMNNKLELLVGIALLLVESFLLYLSKIDILFGFSILLVMLSIIKGNRTLFTSNREENLDEDTEQEIKQLRELVRK